MFHADLVGTALAYQETRLAILHALRELDMGTSDDVMVLTSAEFDAMSDDDLAQYLRVNAETVRDLVDEVSGTILPKLQSPMAKLTLKSLTRMFGT